VIETIGVEGHVLVSIYERGKLIGTREGKNIWTNAGRAYLARRMSYEQALPNVTGRPDCILYMGVGDGNSPQVPSVTRVANPVPYQDGVFLADVIVPATYPTVSSVKYTRIFSDGEISLLGNTVNVSEFGLFTDGNPGLDYAAGSRVVSLAEAANQEPVAYKTVDPFPKNQDTSFKIEWTIRFV
jgi:hypothetical protein